MTIRRSQAMPKGIRLLGFLCLAALAPPSHGDCGVSTMLDLPPIIAPKLATQGDTVADFIPAQWRLVDKVEGDLNGDKLADLALVIVNTDPRNINHQGDCPESSEPKGLDTNPHGLIVAFGQQGGGYLRVAQDFTVIPRPFNTDSAEAGYQVYDSLAIKKKVLRLVVNDNPSPWGRRDIHTYLFRFETNCMRLIGHEEDYLGGPVLRDTVSTNFLTGKSIRSHVSEYKPYSEETNRFKHAPYCLGCDNIPMEFE